MTDRPDYAREIRYSLGDPRALCEALGLLAGKGSWQRQAAGLVIRCPVHADNSPSCSVQSRKGFVLWRCHGCGASGDALTLVAAVNQLSTKRDFKRVLLLAAELAGRHDIVSALESGSHSPMPIAAPIRHQDEPERGYPSPDSIESLWRVCVPITDDGQASDWVRSRGLDPERVDAAELARALPVGVDLPRWAVCRGGTWAEAGYRLVIPMFDAEGIMRTVRVGRVVDGDGPKRRPPFGHKASGVVMADALGVGMLRGAFRPERVIVAEGEPDFLTHASRNRDASTACVGVVTGSWSSAFAARVPRGSRVVVRTHHDDAGEKYAREIASTLRGRCFLRRSEAA